jgi:RND family efflux transporter MFP subunit
LLSSDRIDVPVVVGWRRPAILAPERLTAADPKTIDAILLHELAHVRRGDYAWNLLLRFLQSLYWPNPLLWLIGRAVSRVREQACDEVCIHWLGGSENYRATLVELAGSLLRRPLAALGMAMAGSSRLQQRLEQLGASRGRAECQSRGPWRFTALAVVALAAGMLGALRLTNRAAAEPANRLHIVIDKDKLRADESKARKDRDVSVVAIAQADPFRAENTEPSASTAPAAESKEEQPHPLEKQREKPSPSKTANEGAGEAAADEPAEPVKVRVEKVRREDFVVQTSQPGTLKPSRTMELYAKVDGLIVARNANVGDVVKAGQVLAEIEAPELDAELEQAQALTEQAPVAVEQAQGKLDETLAGLEGARADLEKCEAELEQAASNLEFAEAKYKRLLAMAGSVSRQEIDEKQSQAHAAKGAISTSKARLSATKAEVKQAEAAVAVAKAGLRIAELRLGAAQQGLKRIHQRAAYRQVMAPADGVVVRQAAEPGSFAKFGGEPLFVISGTKVLTMQSQIPERDALRVTPGQHAQVWFDAQRDGKPRDSKVTRVGYVIDPKTRTMLVEIELDNSDGRLRPGMYGRVTIDLETHPGVLTMPPKFVFPGYCFRVVDGRAVKTKFEWAQSWDDPDGRQEIKNGLSEGDVVIIGVISPEGEPWNLITDGSVVDILNQEK